jgi:DNA-binding SARP family transcriptional activator
MSVRPNAYDERPAGRQETGAGGGPTRRVHLFGGPFVSVDGISCHVPHGCRRLLTFVAIRPGRVERSYAAGMLWPFGDDTRASSNLRSALWRLRRAGIDVLAADKWSLWLDADVGVDLRQTADWAGRLIHGTDLAGDRTLAELPADALSLLPGWQDDWVIIERERIRQRVLHALEALSRQLSAEGRHADAIDVAFRAVADEPLRESAQRVLMEAYLAQGNDVEARRLYADYAALVRAELGVAPSRQLTELMAAATSAANPGVGTPGVVKPTQVRAPAPAARLVV